MFGNRLHFSANMYLLNNLSMCWRQYQLTVLKRNAKRRGTFLDVRTEKNPNLENTNEHQHINYTLDKEADYHCRLQL